MTFAQNVEMLVDTVVDFVQLEQVQIAAATAVLSVILHFTVRKIYGWATTEKAEVPFSGTANNLLEMLTDFAHTWEVSTFTDGYIIWNDEISISIRKNGKVKLTDVHVGKTNITSTLTYDELSEITEAALEAAKFVKEEKRNTEIFDARDKVLGNLCKLWNPEKTQNSPPENAKTATCDVTEPSNAEFMCDQCACAGDEGKPTRMRDDYLNKKIIPPLHLNKSDLFERQVAACVNAPDALVTAMNKARANVQPMGMNHCGTEIPKYSDYVLQQQEDVVRVHDNGDLQLKSDKPEMVRPIVNGKCEVQFKDGVIKGWYFDPTKGIWKENV